MQPGATKVFLDANVLFSRTLRDWFCLISLESGIEGVALYWSEDVLAEMIYHLRKQNPHLADKQVGGWRQRLHDSFPYATITGYSIDPVFLHGDPFDAHVIAAALHGQVDYLITNNVKDFSLHADKLDFEIYTPDDFLCLVAERRPDATYRTTKRQLKFWNLRTGYKSLPDALTAAGCPRFAIEVRKILQRIALQVDY